MQVLKNYKYALLHMDGTYTYVKDDDALERMRTQEDGVDKIKDGDVILQLTQETVRLAQQRNYVEIV